MKDNTITMSILKRHIKHSLKKYNQVGFLGLVENKDLTPEVEALFTYYNDKGMPHGYNWVSGNDKMRALVAQIKSELSKEGIKC